MKRRGHKIVGFYFKKACELCVQDSSIHQYFYILDNTTKENMKVKFHEIP